MAGLRRTLLHRLGWALLLGLLLSLLLLLGSMHPLLLLVLVLLLLLHGHSRAVVLLLLLRLGLLLVVHALSDKCMSALLGDFTVEATCVAAICGLRVRGERRFIDPLVLHRTGVARRQGREQHRLGLGDIGGHRGWLRLRLRLRRRLARRRLRLGLPREVSDLQAGQLLLPTLSQ